MLLRRKDGSLTPEIKRSRQNKERSTGRKKKCRNTEGNIRKKKRTRGNGQGRKERKAW